MRRLLAGDDEGYYRDYRGTTDELAAALKPRLALHRSAFGPRRRARAGTDPTGLVPERFVFALQNHDQVGNRALGERLHHQIDLAA